MQRIDWLEERDEELWGALWAFITWVPEQLDRHLKRTSSVALPEFLTMLAIARNDNTITMSRLARWARMSPSRLSHVMDRLERRGLTERLRNSEDRRSTYAVLTPEGQELLAEAAPPVMERMRESIFEVLTPEEAEQLTGILRKMLKRGKQQIIG